MSAYYDMTSPDGIRVWVGDADEHDGYVYIVDDYDRDGDTALSGNIYPGDEEPGETTLECAIDIGAAVARNEFDDDWHPGR